MARLIPVALDRAEYRRLTELAAAADRDVFQQVRHIVRQAVREQGAKAMPPAVAGQDGEGR